MLPLIIVIVLLAGVIFFGTKISASRKKDGGRDYEGYFKENEKKSLTTFQANCLHRLQDVRINILLINS